MKIFIIDGPNSKFSEITTGNLRKVSYKNFVYETEVSEDRIVQWLAKGILKLNLEYLQVWQMLYSFMGKPYQNMEHWQYKLQCKVNELEVAKNVK